MKFLIILSLLFMLSGCGFGSGEDGHHRGFITDVSVAGWFCKTYEGQIMSGSGNAAIHYEFTIGSRDIYEKLMKYQASNKEVNLHYYSPRIYSACSSFYPTIVDGVSAVEN